LYQRFYGDCIRKEMRAKFTLLLGLADAIVIDVKLADGLPCGGISDFNITFCHCFVPLHIHVLKILTFPVFMPLLLQPLGFSANE